MNDLFEENFESINAITDFISHENQINNMCGIAGIIDYQQRKQQAIVEEMLSAIAYRGPDESGIYILPLQLMGNVRLSIIDIAGGQQPLSDSSGRYWIVFNGEIFNYPELRKDLEKQGCRFQYSVRY